MSLKHEGVDGAHFAVWAPNARRVSVVGDFNDWDGRRDQMRKRIDSGVWEIFLPGVGAGPRYKFEIIGANGALMPLKADPFGRAGELRPSTASVVVADAPFPWTDEAFMRDRARKRSAPRADVDLRGPSAVLARGEGGRFLSYDELAGAADPLRRRSRLHPYRTAADQRASARRLLGLSADRPVRAHARGTAPPDGFTRFVDRAHQAGLGVILDWVPAHFPTDAHGLAHVRRRRRSIEHADPRRGFHPDWNTAIYDFGRREVANFLICNALYWLDRFHIDGLRVDAVASMLYLDYSRKAGRMGAQSRRLQRQSRRRAPFCKRFNETVYGLFPGVDHDRGGIDLLGRRVAADQPGRPRLRLQMEHGLDERHAGLYGARIPFTANGTTTD